MPFPSQRGHVRRDPGFSLVELLVVMIIVGVLAGIALPLFVNQRARAHDSATMADVTLIGKYIVTQYVDGDQNQQLSASVRTVSGGSEPDVYQINGDDVGRKSNSSIGTPTLTYVSGTAPASARWCVELTNTEGDTKTWSYSASAGLRGAPCS